MKKIGILTTYFATNFGAMLQPFAMKRTLENMGYEVEMIRYKQPKVYNVYEPLTWRKLPKRPTSIIRFLLDLPILKLKYKKKRYFLQYMQKHVQPKLGFIRSIPADYDYYFFGSDQIWNPKITGGFDKVYFGEFPVKEGAKKIAYAASAEDIVYDNGNIAYLRNHLEKLDHIAVRENKLAEDLRKYTGIKNIEVVVDPTMLADPSIYKEIDHQNPLPGKKFVLFYKIRNCIDFLPKIYKYAQSIGAELLILSSWYEKDIVDFCERNKDVTYLPTAGVEVFLGAIQNAECIFTPSFHGCVFPILYHKPFFSLVLSDSWNTRANDLLCSLGLENRLLTINSEIINESIDFIEVDRLVAERRNDSMIFVKKALGLEV